MGWYAKEHKLTNYSWLTKLIQFKASLELCRFKLEFKLVLLMRARPGKNPELALILGYFNVEVVYGSFSGSRST